MIIYYVTKYVLHYTVKSISNEKFRLRLIKFVEFVNRTLVLPYDLGRFDAMVSAHEKEALEYLSGFVPGMYHQIRTSYFRFSSYR